MIIYNFILTSFEAIQDKNGLDIECCSGILLREMASILVKKINLKKQMTDIKRKGAKEDTVRIMDKAIQHLRDYLDIRKGRYTGSKEVSFLLVTL